MSKSRLRYVWIFYAASLGLHALIGIGAASAPQDAPPPESVAVVLAEIQENQAKEEPPRPPPPPPPKPRAPPAPPPPPPPPTAAEPPKVAAGSDAPKGPAGFDDLGDLMGGSGPGGIAMPMQAPKEAAAPAAPKKKVASLGPRPGDECAEPVVKPKPIKIVQPSYTEAARQASIEGVVRVEITLDEHGKILSVKVIKGLGFGLDESAVAAVKQMEIAPATLCKKPIQFTFSVPIRFELGS